MYMPHTIPVIQHIKTLKEEACQNEINYKKERLEAYLRIAFCDISKAAYRGWSNAHVYCPSDICNEFMTQLRNDGFTIVRSKFSYNHYIIDLTDL